MVDTQLVEAPVGLALGGDGHRQLDPAMLAVELQGDFLYSTPLGNDQVNRVDDDIASGQPSVRLRDNGFEAWCAFDPAANGVVQFGISVERVDWAPRSRRP